MEWHPTLIDGEISGFSWYPNDSRFNSFFLADDNNLWAYFRSFEHRFCRFKGSSQRTKRIKYFFPEKYQSLVKFSGFAGISLFKKKGPKKGALLNSLFLQIRMQKLTPFDNLLYRLKKCYLRCQLDALKLQYLMIQLCMKHQ